MCLSKLLNFFKFTDMEDTMMAPSGNKRALLVGINRYALKDADLKGCVNDVMNMNRILLSYFEFQENNIKILLDDQATKNNILSSFDELVKSSVPGDELVFHYSGHGSQIPDFDCDEYDKLDEILIPHDMDWRDPNQLSDDVIYSILKGLPHGVYLTIVCDSCHSGTITRGVGAMPSVQGRFLPPAEFVSKSIEDMVQPNLNKFGLKQRGTTPQRHVLLSGCKEHQTSADAYIGRTWQGALTNALVTQIENDPEVNWVELYNSIFKFIKVGGFPQDPQLSGDGDLVDRLIFGGCV